MTDLWALERSLHTDGYTAICGVDEAGRGPLAGPVVAAAVILPKDAELPGLGDSKKLTEQQREALFEEIQAIALAYGIGHADVEEIDQVNILNATYLAMNRAIAALDIPPELCLIDGNRSDGIKYPNRCIVGGDGVCASIAAASILAKVTRDRFMVELHQQYPQYGFDRHKGYPTKAHYTALDTYGPAPVHRRTFLRKWEAGR
ncbi:MAG: ribonuclease HII [Oscillospiraceae bacterium]|nr:ribonuclease HII [Oscillospiraceae bacterium]